MEHHKKFTLPAVVICLVEHHKKFTLPAVTFAEARKSIIKKLRYRRRSFVQRSIIKKFTSLAAVICLVEYHKDITLLVVFICLAVVICLAEHCKKFTLLAAAAGPMEHYRKLILLVAVHKKFTSLAVTFSEAMCSHWSFRASYKN